MNNGERPKRRELILFRSMFGTAVSHSANIGWAKAFTDRQDLADVTTPVDPQLQAVEDQLKAARDDPSNFSNWVSLVTATEKLVCAPPSSAVAEAFLLVLLSPVGPQRHRAWRLAVTR